MPAIYDLYLAAGLAELNAKSELPPNITKSKPELLARTASKVFDQGKESLQLGDEEKSYVLFVKYLNLLSAIKKSGAYGKDKTYYNSMFPSASVKFALEQAENISNSLKDRYEEREAKAVAAKMAAASVNTSTDEEIDDLFSSPTDSPGSEPRSLTGNGAKNGIEAVPLSITPVDLYTWLESAKGGHLLLVDIREQVSYDESHIKLESADLINVPGNLLCPGILSSKLRSQLTARSQSLFDARANYTKIVLLDWDSKYADLQPAAPLSILKDAIYKFDQQIKLACEPQILDGGYKEWVKFYPMFSTNSSVLETLLPKSTFNIPDVSSIDYDIDFDKEEPPADVGGQGEPVPPITAPLTQPPHRYPSVNRSNKPTNANIVPAGRPNGHHVVVCTSIPTPQNTTLPTSIVPSAASTAIPTVSATLSPRATPTTRSSGAAATPTPTVNRNLKPQAPTSQVVTGLSESDRRAEEELYSKLREQNRRMIAEAGDRLKQLNADKVQIADLTKLKESESQAVADLMRKKKQLEQEIEKQQNKIVAATQVQQEHDASSSTPQVNRSLKPNLEDWEQRLSQLELDDDKLSQQQDNKGKEEARLKAEEQSRLIAEHNQQIKQEQARKEAERARLAEEQRVTAEKKKIAEEQRLSIEKAKLEAEQRLAVEKAKIEKRLEAENARKEAEQARKEAERLRLLEEERKAEADKARLAQERERSAAAAAKQAGEQQKRTEATRGPSTNELPPGWQRRLDDHGNPFYINYQTNERTSTPPKHQAPVKPLPKAPVQPSQPPVRQPQGSPPAMRSTTRLKSDETTFGVDGEISSSREVKSKMKKFNSIPNLSQIDDMPVEPRPSPAPFDRTNKPAPLARQQSVLQTAKIDRRRMNNLSPVYGSTIKGLTGLYNMGNTCYMNSALQCLSHTAPLLKYFCEDMYAGDVNGESMKGSRGAISAEFALLLKVLWAGNYKYIVPKDFKFVFGRKQPSFDHFKQMDSQEFLQILLDMFHEDLNSKGHLKVKATGDIPSTVKEEEAAKRAFEEYKQANDSIIVSLFTGQQRGITFCANCGKKSYKFDSYNFLPLEIQASGRTSLKHCLDQYLRVDPLEDYKCEKCHRKQSKRKLDLYTLPTILLVFFKRFDQYSYHFSKKTNMIDFPEELNMSSITENRRYFLYGVVNHYGSLDTGHYTAFCKSIATRKWYKFNDENVSELRSSSDVKSSAAYILFYTSLSSNVQ